MFIYRDEYYTKFACSQWLRSSPQAAQRSDRHLQAHRKPLTKFDNPAPAWAEATTTETEVAAIRAYRIYLQYAPRPSYRLFLPKWSRLPRR